MTGKNTINPVLRKVASILSEKPPYALKTLFQYKWGGSKTPTTYKMELLVILVTSEPELTIVAKSSIIDVAEVLNPLLHTTTFRFLLRLPKPMEDESHNKKNIYSPARKKEQEKDTWKNQKIRRIFSTLSGSIDANSEQ